MRRTGEVSRWYILAILTGICTVHIVDRSVMAVIIEPVRKEFGLGDAQLGMLTGFSHSAALALMVLPVGWLADRVNRVRLLSGIVVLWSALTMMGAFATSYLQLLLMRISVGAAEAGGSPTSASLIGDVFPRRDHPTAFGIYYLGTALGTGATFLLGSYIVQQFGWRSVFLVAGPPGILLGIILLLTVRDPRPSRREAGADGQAPWSSVAALLRNRPALAIIGAGSIAAFAQYSAWMWIGSFLIRAHHFDLVMAGVVVGISAVLGKGLGSAVAGPASRWLARDRREALWKYPAATLAASVPVAWLAVTSANGAVAVAGVFLLGILMGGWAGQGTAILVGTVQADQRGVATAGWHLGTNLIGAGLGPLLTGVASDALGDGNALGVAIGATTTLNLLAAGGFLLACRLQARQGSDVV